MVEYCLKINKSVPGSHRIPKGDVLSLSNYASSSFSVAGGRSSSGILFRSSGEFVDCGIFLAVKFKISSPSL